MARSLRAKFENWTAAAGGAERDNNNKTHGGAYDLPSDYTPQTDTAKSLKAKFESFRSDASAKPLVEKRKPRVNRFVVSPRPVPHHDRHGLFAASSLPALVSLSECVCGREAVPLITDAGRMPTSPDCTSTAANQAADARVVD